MASMEGSVSTLPSLPIPPDQFLEHVAAHPHVPMQDLIKPYLEYDSKLRTLFAQQHDHPATSVPNAVSVFSGSESTVTIRARDLEAESAKDKEQYIMPLNGKLRKPDGAPAIAQSLKDFKSNFNIFSESSLADLDWSNVVVAGSAVVTSLLPVPEKHAGSKRALRQYYHEQYAPASDVDLFLHGLSEEQAIEKIKQIEQNVRDAILVETTTVRTKYAVTIASQYPVRHVQIVLRVYKSISEILTSFDIDSSCAAYDGTEVYACPRALASYMTQINTIDLSRRSPSYESRLSKYAKRGFEVFWPHLDRSKVDPTIFERSFGRTEGLARLLILEKLPTSSDRDSYLDQRRAERGRPSVHRSNRRHIPGDIKADWEDEVAEWVDSNEVSNYHTFSIPYGPKFNSRKVEKLIYTKDLLLNAEWNKPKDREVNLHRHPAFFGSVIDVLEDCCGFCPKPATIEEEEVAEKEREIYISGSIKFLMDNPGRQQIGSFNPITADDWTEMAYVSNTFNFCQAIVDGDSEFVRAWLEQEGNEPNARDWTGRAPLHLAAADSTVEIVQLLIDHGARLVARLVDGRTALHLAAMRGSVEIVSALLRKSEANAEEEEQRVDERRAARKAAKVDDISTSDVDMAEVPQNNAPGSPDEASDIDMVERDVDHDENMDATTEQSMVNIRTPVTGAAENEALEKAESDDPDILDVNVTAWDSATSPLHLAIIHGHIDVVKCLVSEFGADVLLPIKLYDEGSKTARAAILTLLLALQLPLEKAKEMTRTLIELGASVAQADLSRFTALSYCVAHAPDLLETFELEDKTGFGRSINSVCCIGPQYSPACSAPFLIALQARDSLTALHLLANGARGKLDFSTFQKAYEAVHMVSDNSKYNRDRFQSSQDQPVITATKCELPQVAKALVEEHNIDVNTLAKESHDVLQKNYSRAWLHGKTLLDITRDKLKGLRNWESEELRAEPPLKLEADEHYLRPFAEGSYAHWSADCQLKEAKRSYRTEWKQYEDSVRCHDEQTGSMEKAATITKMIEEFESLETCLMDRSAQTFAQLYPDIEGPKESESNPNRRRGDSVEPFQVQLSFKKSSLSHEGEQRYIRLFEAAWVGDIPTVKELTLISWKDEDGLEQPPLEIAAEDQNGISSLVIAIVHGNFELADAIMEIAGNQYAPPDTEKQQRYRVNNHESEGEEVDEDEDEDDEDIRIESEVVDEDFTIEDIGRVSMQVKSRLTPRMLLGRQNVCLSHFFEENESRTANATRGYSFFGPRNAYTLAGKRSNTGTLRVKEGESITPPQYLKKPSSLVQWALCTSSTECLVYLLETGQKYVDWELEKYPDLRENQPRYHTIAEQDFAYAIKANRPELLEEITRRTGAGLPLRHLLAKSGIEATKDKPKYYQGLSVHGKKRSDWADAGRNSMHAAPVENHRPPLLEAARAGSLKSVEWFSSDAPMRCYKNFAKTYKEEKIFQDLTRAKGGFESVVRKFLDARSYLPIHCYLMGNKTADSSALLKHLISSVPESVDAKSRDGMTPLLIAFQLYDDAAVRILIDAGADQTARDNMGNNIVHHLLEREQDEKVAKKLPHMLNLIDKRVVPSLMVERSSEHPGALTPLARYCETKDGKSVSVADIEILKTILKYGGDDALSMINGDGNTPLHTAVRQDNCGFCTVILEHDSSLLFRENSTGVTPYELAESFAITQVCKAPPPMSPGDLYAFKYYRAHRLGITDEWSTDLVRRESSSFVEDHDTDRRTPREKVWDLFREVKTRTATHDSITRRLVTLNEANEVARRLAAKKRNHTSTYAMYAGGRSTYESARRTREINDDEDVSIDKMDDLPHGGDEVQVWLHMAQMSLQDGNESVFGSERGAKAPRK